MYAKYLQKLAALPARTAEWSGRAGPVALWGVDNMNNGSAGRLSAVFQETALHSDSDWYFTPKWYEEGPIEAPPQTVPHLPILNCGTMVPENPAEWTPKNFEWYNATMQAAATLAEKGYIPVTLGGNSMVTMAALEGIKQGLGIQDCVLCNYGADPRVSEPTSPIRVLLEKNALKGYIQIGGRGVDKATRKVRKEHTCRYIDTNALFAHGVFLIKDFRNNWPIYLTIDLGVLDPSCAPGVENPESGGLTVRELLHTLHALRGTKIIGVDIVGYHPKYDIKMGEHPYGLTELAAGKVLKEAILKAYTISTTTLSDGQDRLTEMKKQGQAPTSYPDL